MRRASWVCKALKGMGSSLALACAALAWAHPDASNSKVAPVAPGSEGGAPGTLGKAPTATPTQVEPAAKKQRGAPWLHDQRLRNYRSGIAIRVDQVTHKHWDGVEADRAPAEIWYVATRKPYSAGKFIYCVTPRIEVPNDNEWVQTSFTVTLFKSDVAGPTVRVPESLPKGTSRELVDAHADSAWCVQQGPKPQKWSLETEHGSANVVFP